MALIIGGPLGFYAVIRASHTEWLWFGPGRETIPEARADLDNALTYPPAHLWAI